ncbi:hypothetical protein BX666DRAFT_1970750 [Dichotomocladium elegans]|nr:hypothetical protein BX666DRAFT_1970750 [Dichotomocladium elegans]
MAREKQQCGNPLWREWIQEWAEEAKDKQLKSYYTYKKAADALGKCPLTFTHPCEAIVVQYIGEGMVKRLEKRLEKYCKENDLPFPERPTASGKRSSSTQDTGDAVDDLSSSQSQKRQRRSGRRPYVPRYRTGAYAILIALLEHRQINQLTSPTKEQIIRLAENHCDSSFDLVESGKHYTAWNSMKTLIDKDFVWKHGQPPTYTLTDAGIVLAEELQNSSALSTFSRNSVAEEESTMNNGSISSQKQPHPDNEREADPDDGESEVDLSLYVLDPSKYRTATVNNVDDDDDELPLLPSSLPTGEDNICSSSLPIVDVDNDDDDNSLICLDLSSTPPPMESISSTGEPFEYTYLDIQKNPVRHVSQAAFDVVQPSGSLMHKIRFSTKQRYHPITDTLKNIQKETETTLTAYIVEDQASVVCPGLPIMPVLPLGREEEDDFWPPDPCSTPSGTQQATQQTNLSTAPMYSQDPDPSEWERYPPESYEITLLIDTREIKMKSNRDYFLEQLTEKGIKTSKRALELGDMIWVAQKKGSRSPNDELFLDIIVERKRLDDLLASIKDGRFNEQKYRLGRSGARKVIYLIEEHNKDEVMASAAQAIQTAMSSTQVVDNFFLKRTKSINDTVDYLANVTNIIKSMFNGVTLHRVPDHSITRENYLDKKKQLNKHQVITYTLYSQLNSKSDTQTLKDVYMRMLLTVRGVSVEKAVALMKVYPTPHALLKAYAAVSTPEEGKNLARESTKDGISRRRWNAALSLRLWEVWGQRF